MSNPIIPPIPARLVAADQNADDQNADDQKADDESTDDRATVDQDVAEAAEANKRLDR